MKKLIILVVLTLTLSWSCKDESWLTVEKQEPGNVAIKFEKTSIPSSTYFLVASLSRVGFDSLKVSSSISSLGSTTLTFSGVTPGLWLLKVWAYDQNGIVIYYGDKKIDVLSNSITKTDITLSPAGYVDVTINFGHAFSVNDHFGNPLITAANFSSPDLNGVFFPIVRFDGGKYKMWYSKWYSDRSYNIEYAESVDGIKWKNIVNYPVLDKGNTGSWDQYGVSGGPVNFENGLYTMYYVGVGSKDGDSYIGAADSYDGIYWVKRNAPLIKIIGKRVAPNSLTKINSTYYLFFSYTKLNAGEDTWGISVATSQDGGTWNVVKENILPLSESWETPNPNGCSVFSYNDKLYMIYGSLSNLAMGIATSQDGVNWTKSPSNPIFTQNNCYNHWSSDVRYPNILQNGNSFKLYYTGSVSGKLAIAVADLYIK